MVKKKKSNLLIYFLIFSQFILSCNTTNTFVRPEYQGKKIKNATLLVQSITENNFTKNTEIFNEIGINLTDEEWYSLFTSSFKSILKSKSTFQKSDYLFFKEKTQFETHVFEINENEKFSIDIPEKQNEFDTSESVYILIFQDLFISFSKEIKETSNPAKHYTVSSTSDKDLRLKSRKRYNYFITVFTKYAIYDNSMDKVVSFGKISIKNKYVPPKSIENSLKMGIEKLVLDILDRTPFTKN